jgi:large subunit ribosomal protein L15
VADVDLAALQSAGIVSKNVLGAKIILSGKLTKKLNVKGDVKASKGARAAIEGAGGKVEVIEPKPQAPKKPKKEKKPEAKPAEESPKA